MWIIAGEFLFYIIIFVFLFGGLVLTIFALPGVWLIWLVILFTGIIKGFEIIPIWFIVLTFFFSVFVTIIDNFIIAYGSKKFGGGKWGMIGGILGSIIGLFLANIPGLFFGAFFGAFFLEHVVAKKNYEDSLNSGVGSSIGVVLAIVFKLFLCLGMIVSYLLIFIF